MNTIQLRFGSMGASELFQTDWKGESISRADSTEYWLTTPFVIKGIKPTREFSLITTVLAKVPREGLPMVDREAESTVLSLIASELTQDFARWRSWKTFSETVLQLDRVRTECIVKDEQLESTPINVEVQPILYEQLATDGARIERVDRAYDKAKKYLFNLSSRDRQYDLSDKAHEIRTLLNFIEECNRCSADGRMWAWYQEKTPRVKRAFEDMLRRKDLNHPGYKQSAESASGALYSFGRPVCVP